jgi:hypothetical protein
MTVATRPLLEELTKATLKPSGPLVSVCLDISRNEERGQSDVAERWQAQERHLRAAGAPETVLHALGQAVTAVPGRGGEAGRLLVATADGTVLLDLVFPGRPVRDESTFAPVPQLLPLVRALHARSGYALVLVDRTGADIEVFDVFDNSLERDTVVGSNDVIHHVHGGLLSTRRLQTRVEDSWARNAGEVAAQLDAVVREQRPPLVLVDGDETAVVDLLHALSEATKKLTVQLHTGGRAQGISETHREQAIEDAVAARRKAGQDAVLDTFRQGEGRQELAVQGLDAVVDVLRREQLQTLLLADDPSSTLTVWVGSEPGQLGMTEAEVRELGVAAPQQVRADAAIVWATLATGGDICLFDREDAQFTGGVAANLRWSDRSTPHDDLAAMPGHGDSGRAAGEES